MQTKFIRTGVLLIGALASTLGLVAQAKKKPTHKLHAHEMNIAVLFNLEHAQVAQSGTPGFWLKGGAADASLTFWKGLGLAGNVTGGHASNIQSNVSLGKIAFMAGPRYTFDTSKYADRMTKKHHTEVFGEWLLGGVHAFYSTFPGSKGVQSSASAFSMQMGGGADVEIAKGFGLRALEMDWVHTNLPNNASNTQNDFRIAFGLSWKR